MTDTSGILKREYDDFKQIENEMAINAIDPIKSWSRGTLYNNKFEFVGARSEKKNLLPEEARVLRAKKAKGKLPTLGSTFVNTIFDLNTTKLLIKSGADTTKASRPFFQLFHDLHARVDNKKKALRQNRDD